ncbi:hypothetical protein EV426DRAFT_701592 [Tirmania nivea]|nr:hypothetical protein EV426DRAFT_701592 [Tirmania nivea]
MYPNFVSRSVSLSTSRRQRAKGASPNLRLESPVSPRSQSFGKGIASAAKSGLQHLFRHPGKTPLILEDLSLLPSSAFSTHSSEPPVLTLPASAFARASLLPVLRPGPQKDAPKRRHTYKLFPSSSPPPQIISPVYGVNVLHRNNQVVLPRLRGTQNYSSSNSTPPMSAGKNPKVVLMGRKSSTDEHPLTVSDLRRQGSKAKEKTKDHKESISYVSLRESQPRTLHKEKIVYAPPSRPNGNMQGLTLGRCLRIKSVPRNSSHHL